jgi:hypothetical protein
MNIVVYDIEIENAVPDQRSQIIPNIRYCNGWHDYQGMGVAVVTAYEYQFDRYRIFFKDNLKDFDALQRTSQVLVGFNSKRFDDLVLACNGVVIDTSKVYDILPELWEAAGLPPVKHRDDFDRKLHGGYNLDAVSYINTGFKKSGSGAMAPVLWQQGKRGEVVDYGLADCWLTKLVFDKVLENGELKDPKSGRRLAMRPPFKV